MAYVVFKDGRKKIVSREVGIQLWEGLQNSTRLDAKQQSYVALIAHVYLNHRYAPETYLEAYEVRLQSMYGKDTEGEQVPLPWYQKY